MNETWTAVGVTTPPDYTSVIENLLGFPGEGPLTSGTFCTTILPESRRKNRRPATYWYEELEHAALDGQIVLFDPAEVVAGIQEDMMAMVFNPLGVKDWPPETFEGGAFRGPSIKGTPLGCVIGTRPALTTCATPWAASLMDSLRVRVRGILNDLPEAQEDIDALRDPSRRLRADALTALRATQSFCRCADRRQDSYEAELFHGLLLNKFQPDRLSRWISFMRPFKDKAAPAFGVPPEILEAKDTEALLAFASKALLPK